MGQSARTDKLSRFLPFTAANYTLDDLPEGYALFLHHKLQPNGSDRTDIYLFVGFNDLASRTSRLNSCCYRVLQMSPNSEALPSFLVMLVRFGFKIKILSKTQ
jgi:hypothetical protein